MATNPKPTVLRRIPLAILSCAFLLAQQPQASDKPSPVPSHTRAHARARALEQRRDSIPLPSPLLLTASEAGTAVYYHDHKRSAKGENDAETFDEQSTGLVGSHAYYPIGSLVRVTNTMNGKVVTVRINGRIASSSRHVISVNDRAARELDFFRNGIGQVRLELVAKSKAE